jgi:hypothetical protein
MIIIRHCKPLDYGHEDVSNELWGDLGVNGYFLTSWFRCTSVNSLEIIVWSKSSLRNYSWNVCDNFKP